MFHNSEQIVSFFNSRKKLGIQLGLDRIKRLLNGLDNPQHKIMGIHVAGTNGKGSTVHLMSRALIANGYKVGVFTSPSFEGLTGHILCNDHKITEEKLIELFNKIYPIVDSLDQLGIHATEFEILTAMAFLYFENHVDICLIETGMGGRFDTTNCFQPILSIITNIDNDHSAFLGNSIKEIATHKVGIIKNKVPIIVGDVNKDALKVIDQEIENKRAPLFLLNKDFSYEILEQTESSQSFIWKYMDESIEINLAMLGKHQIHNCALTVMALFLLKKIGIQINLSRAIKSISHVTLPGRFEVLRKKDQTIILDGAHNLAGIKSFIQTVRNNYGNIDRKHLIFTAFKDKDLKVMLNELIPHFSTTTLTTFNHPRAVSTHFLKNMIDKDIKNVVEKELAMIINNIKHANYLDDSYYFFTGSFHFIVYVRKLFMEKL